MPYKSPDLVQKLQAAFYEINLKGLGVKSNSIRELTTMELTQEQKNN
jgi:hypothetical protein